MRDNLGCWLSFRWQVARAGPATGAVQLMQVPGSHTAARRVAIRLALAAVVLCIALCPRSVTQGARQVRLDSGGVVRGASVQADLGMPLQCARLRRTRWSVLDAGAIRAATSMEVQLLAHAVADDLERNMNRCGLEQQTFSYRANQVVLTTMRTKPRTPVVVISWWRLATNVATATGLIGGIAIAIAAKRRAARSHRILSGRCAWCGYDVRACVSEVCPECGQKYRSPD